MSTDDDTTRPCAHCGKPVPQRAAAGRPFRYCRDNDGACQNAARNSRMRHRNSPGLAGQVAKAYEIVDRLEHVAETLTDALAAELSPVGVERQVAEVRAEAAASVAAAQTERDAEITRFLAERDEARQDAERAARLARSATEAAEAARAHAAAVQEAADDQVAAALTQAEQSLAAATRAAQAQQAAQTERDGAKREAAAAEALRLEAYKDRDAARSAADQAQAAAAEKARELSHLDQILSGVRIELANGQEELRKTGVALTQRESEIARLEAERKKVEAERNSAQAEVATLRSETASLRAENTALRADAASLRSRIDELTGQVGQLADTLTQLTARLTVPVQQPAAVALPTEQAMAEH